MRFIILSALLSVASIVCVTAQSSGTVGYNRTTLNTAPTNLNYRAATVTSKITNASIYGITGILKGDGIGGSVLATPGVDYEPAGGGGGTTVSVNGTAVSTPNFTNSATATFSVATTNVSVNPTNLANAQIAAGAAIDFSKLSGVAALVHTHAGEDITSGTVAAARIDSAIATDAEVAAGYQPLDSDLTALAGNGSNGLLAKTGSGTVAARTITGDSEITVSNGDGVSGNPTLAIASTIARDSDLIWTNDNGTIRATSPVADNGSAAFSMTSSNTLTQDLSKLFSITNGANGGVFHIGRNGGLMVGPNTENFWLGGTDAGETLLSFNDTTQGDADFFSIFTGVGNPAGVYHDVELWGQPWHASVWVRSFTNNNETLTAIELYAGTNDTRIAIRTGNTTNVIISPTAADGVTPLFFNTSVSHTSGNLLQLQDNGVDNFVLDYAGNIYFLGGSLSTPANFTLFDGLQASRTFTYNLSGTDPVWTASSGVLDLSTGTLRQGGIDVAIESTTISAGVGMSGGGDLSANRTLTWAPETRVNDVVLFDGSQASRALTINLSGTDPVWTYSSAVAQLTGHLRFPDATYDIGASGATRPRHGYFSGVVTAGLGFDATVGNMVLRGGTAYGYFMNGLGALRWASDGVMRLVNDAQTDFGRLQFGGTSSSFPALKRSTTQLQVKLADDSAFTSLGTGIIELNQVASGGTPAANSSRIYSKDAAGTDEVYAMDEAGNESLQTPHPDDAPPNMEDRQDGLQDEFAKNANYYIGKVEWINQTRMARFVQKLMNNTNFLVGIGETNLAALPLAQRRIYHVETFNQYNTRTGTTNPLVQLNWNTVQNQKQSAYDAARAAELILFNTPFTNELGQVITTNTNVVVRPALNIRKPKPSWMP